MRFLGQGIRTAARRWLLFIILIPSLTLNIYLLIRETSSSGPGQKAIPGIKVIGVIDGDTLVLDGKVRVRLRHLDAPELENCGGKQAKKALESLVVGKRVTLEERIMGQQGRPLSLVYQGDTLVNLRMLASGWVRYHSDNSSQEEILKKAAQDAKDKKIGIYGPKCYQKDVNPDNPSCTIKGNIDKNSGRKLYYYPGCAQYDFVIVEKDIGESWFCSQEKAEQAGFTKAKTCH